MALCSVRTMSLLRTILSSGKHQFDGDQGWECLPGTRKIFPCVSQAAKPATLRISGAFRLTQEVGTKAHSPGKLGGNLWCRRLGTTPRPINAERGTGYDSVAIGGLDADG